MSSILTPERWKFQEHNLNLFNDIFHLRKRPHSRIFVQDGDPGQNGTIARKALDAIGAKLFSIPPQGPDLNPVENVFHLVKRSLTREAKEKKITYESVEQYCERIRNTFKILDRTVIDNIISTMPKRINAIRNDGGSRIRYWIYCTYEMH